MSSLCVKALNRAPGHRGASRSMRFFFFFVAGPQVEGLLRAHVTYRHGNTGCAARCPQDLFLRETRYSVLSTRWKPVPRHKNQIISRKLGLFYFLALPKLYIYMVANEFTARRASLELLGSLDTSTKHSWCAQQEDGNTGQ